MRENEKEVSWRKREKEKQSLAVLGELRGYLFNAALMGSTVASVHAWGGACATTDAVVALREDAR